MASSGTGGLNGVRLVKERSPEMKILWWSKITRITTKITKASLRYSWKHDPTVLLGYIGTIKKLHECIACIDITVIHDIVCHTVALSICNEDDFRLKNKYLKSVTSKWKVYFFSKKKNGHKNTRNVWNSQRRNHQYSICWIQAAWTKLKLEKPEVSIELVFIQAIVLKWLKLDM